MQRNDLALQVPISYISVPVATESSNEGSDRDIVEWPVLDPYDYVLCLQFLFLIVLYIDCYYFVHSLISFRP